MYTKDKTKEYLMNRKNTDWTAEEPDEDHFRLTTPYAMAEVTFHPMDIVELQIINSSDGTSRFYLHFQLNEDKHAEELLDEMLATLRRLEKEQTIRVLLTCTSALTTSYFASELNRAAETMKLNYSFAAVSIHGIYEKGFDYDVILVAPQAAHEYENLKKIFTGKIVMKIPASVFGQYSTGGVIGMLMDALREKEDSGQEVLTKVLRSAFDNPYRILSVCMINHKNEYRIAYRIFDHGRKTLDKEVIKPAFSLQDIDDLIGYVLVRHKNIAAIGLALPGIANRGVLYHKYDNMDSRNVGIWLSEKYNKPVILSNDVNAIAMGYFALHEGCENMVFHFQPRGMVQAGAGIIIGSRLHRGYKSAAGEIASLTEAVVRRSEQKIQTPEGAMEIVGKALLAYIAVIAPEKIVVYSELTPDMEAMREWLGKYVADEYIPELIHVTHLKEFMLAGAMIHALEILGRDPSMYIEEGAASENGAKFARILKEVK